MSGSKQKDQRQGGFQAGRGCNKEPKGSNLEKKETLDSDDTQNKPPLDSGTALQFYLDRIPIISIPGIKNSPEVQVPDVNTGDSVRDAVELLYEKNVSGAPITDRLDPKTTTGRFSDRYIGFVDFASVILWSLEQSKGASIQDRGNDGNEMGKTFIFTLLEQNPQIGQTKIGELAKSFLWDPFFPVGLDDTLLHVLLLLSKHPLQVVPVTERSNSRITGFITQNAVIRQLLQSNGLDWFDEIADKALSQFRFENKDHLFQVYGDQCIAEALHVLWENQVGAIPIVNRGTNRLIGTIRRSDIYLLLEEDNLLHNRRTLTAEEFIHMAPKEPNSDPTIEQDIGALLSAGALRLRNNFIPRMDQPVANKKTDTLKEAMKKLAETKSGFSFLVNRLMQATGLITTRDIIIQFGPPWVDSSIHGGGFFESALEQTGCKMKNGIIVCDY